MNTTFFWLALAFVQWLWNYLIYQRFVSEPEAQSFIDVCTVAKVIVLVLDAEYHGWYVHGDAAYEHADDTMAQLSNHLLEDPGGQARLVPDMPEAHVFQLWLSPAFRRAWRNVQDRVMDKTLELPDPEADVAAREATLVASLPAILGGEARQQKLMRGGGSGPRRYMLRKYPGRTRRLRHWGKRDWEEGTCCLGARTSRRRLGGSKVPVV